MDHVTNLKDKENIDLENMKEHDVDSDFGMLAVKDIKVD